MKNALKYIIIKDENQYNKYCMILEDLLQKQNHTYRQAGKKTQDDLINEIELLTLLIENYEEKFNPFDDLDPVEFLVSLMEEHNLKQKDLVELLKVSKGLVSDILSYKKGFSKSIIRELANHFKVSQEAFNRPYKLITKDIRRIRKSKTNKNLESVG